MSVILLKSKKDKTLEHAHQAQQCTFQFNLTQPTSTFSISIHSIPNVNSLQAALRFTPISLFDPDQHSPPTSCQYSSSASLLTFMGLPDHQQPSSLESIYALPLRTKPFKLLSPTRKSSKNSSDKIRHVERLFYSNNLVSPIQITECPNGSSGSGIGGNHIWDCSMIMAWLISTEPQLVIGEIKSNCEKTLDLEVIELGAGCGLAGLTAARILDSREGLRARVILTDLEEVISTSLAPNVSRTKQALANDTTIEIETIAYTWGTPIPFPTGNINNCIILANDVLYNPENQAVFLNTVLQLFKARQNVSTLLAYRPRTEGDHLFFQTVQCAGLGLERIARIGTVVVFKISPSLSKSDC